MMTWKHTIHPSDTAAVFGCMTQTQSVIKPELRAVIAETSQINLFYCRAAVDGARERCQSVS